MRIAMWSGPRNLSTAMMYSFGARRDCEVVDEPFYGIYLRKTGLDHPMRTEILAAMPEDENAVIERLLAPSKYEIFYQKQMVHHLLPDMRRDWLLQVKNVFLLRHPARVMASYGAKREAFVADDLGFRQQGELFDWLSDQGETPLVIDSYDIRRNPRAALEGLCEALQIGFDEAMLAWLPGGHEADGVWAPHWYGAVHRSIGFAGAEGELPQIAPEDAGVFDEAMGVYDALYAHRLK